MLISQHNNTKMHTLTNHPRITIGQTQGMKDHIIVDIYQPTEEPNEGTTPEEPSAPNCRYPTIAHFQPFYACCL